MRSAVIVTGLVVAAVCFVSLGASVAQAVPHQEEREEVDSYEAVICGWGVTMAEADAQAHEMVDNIPRKEILMDHYEKGWAPHHEPNPFYYSILVRVFP
jgi:uncharacterized protein involved in copper resistance